MRGVVRDKNVGNGPTVITKRILLSAIISIGCGLAVAGAAIAQSYPTRLITIVVPFPPGGNSDLVVRFLADRLSSSLGQPVIVENRPGGAGGTVGARAVASAPPDGYTLLYSSPGPLVVASAIYKNLGYDPLKSFAPIATIMSSPQMLVVNPTVPVTSIQELVSYAKASPGKTTFASPGFGTQPHLLGEMFKLMTSINIVHVPYKGPAPAITDLLAGQVDIYFETIALILPHVNAGKLRAIAIADEMRSPDLPAVPTTMESGFPKLQATFWAGVVAPANTPASIVGKLNMTINEILTSPEPKANLAKLNARPKIGSPQDFAAFMAAESQKWTQVVNTAGIKAE
jgi:tripartite-type tricarboxylate transporter receptor subunit TctC